MGKNKSNKSSQHQQPSTESKKPLDESITRTQLGGGLDEVGEADAPLATETADNGEADAASPDAVTEDTTSGVTAPAAPEPPKPAPAAVPMDQHLARALEDYTEAMRPGKPITAENGAREQLKLWRAIQGVLTKNGSEFVKGWSDLLAYVAKHKRQDNGRDGVFGERYIYRFFDNVRLSSGERRNFERMLNLILTTADPRSRQLTLKQVDLKSTLAGMADENVRQKVIGFYQV